MKTAQMQILISEHYGIRFKASEYNDGRSKKKYIIVPYFYLKRRIG